MKPQARAGLFWIGAYSIFSIGSLISLLPSTAEALSANEVECFKRRKMNDETIRILELHISNSIFAKYDKNCNGRLDRGELKKIEDDAHKKLAGKDRPSELDDLRVRIKYSGEIPFDEIVDKPPEDKEDKKDQRFFLRRDRIDIGLTTKIPSFSEASGASVSSARDYLKSEAVWNVRGAASYVLWKDIEAGIGQYAAGRPYISAYAFAPFVEFSGSASSRQAKPVDDKLIFGGLGQLEIFSGPLFNRQLITFSGYHQTDFYGQADINGGTITWEPTALRAGLGAKTRFTNMFDYIWRLTGTADFRVVNSPGRTNLQADSDYLWVGFQPIIKIWPFPEILDSRFFLEFRPSYFFDAMNGSKPTSSKALNQKEARMFYGAIGFKIDPAGHVNVKVDYQTGMDYMTGVKSDRIMGELTVKY